LGAEDKMDIETRERLRHGIGRPFRAGLGLRFEYPGRCPGLSLGRAVGATVSAPKGHTMKAQGNALGTGTNKIQQP
ncbi:MAG: hypothetical protein NTZ30_20375, partial [Planctomycetota bacterium]|nr:hypothetical protein [Planctomycetota bacterium]